MNALGKKRLEKIYDLADVYHSDNIERVSDDFIREADIESGNFDNVKDCSYSIPSHWDIGKVYKRLIKEVAKKTGYVYRFYRFEGASPSYMGNIRQQYRRTSCGIL